MNEFELIRRYFTRPTPRVVLGVGDDAAIVQPTAGMELHLSCDMLVAGRHFFHDVDPQHLGHKALAVNLSDMAAMGATPRWILLAAALPQIDEAWVADLAQGLFTLAERFEVDVIGGDTTRGPLTLSVTIGGEAPVGCALTRAGANVGDDIWVSGQLGLAAAALAHLQGQLSLPHDVLPMARHVLECPEPRVTLGVALRGIASAALDISDGLLGDISHLLERSQVGAEIHFADLPTHPWLAAQRLAYAHLIAAGGDDYELCFTAAPTQRAAVLAAGMHSGVLLTRIGHIRAKPGLVLLDETGPMILPHLGFDHFA